MALAWHLHARGAWRRVMTERLAFTGEAEDGTQVLVEWFPSADAEVVYVSMRGRGDRTWSPPTECVRTDP